MSTFVDTRVNAIIDKGIYELHVYTCRFRGQRQLPKFI